MKNKNFLKSYINEIIGYKSSITLEKYGSIHKFWGWETQYSAYSVCHLYVFSVKKISISFAYFLIDFFNVEFWKLFLYSRYFLGTSSLSDIYYGNIFSQLVAYLVILFTWSYRERKVSILMRLNFSIVLLWILHLVSIPRTHCPTLDPDYYFLFFYSF